MLYTVYKTQNLVNGKYYFGVHKTNNPYDGYLGSEIRRGLQPPLSCCFRTSGMGQSFRVRVS